MVSGETFGDLLRTYRLRCLVTDSGTRTYRRPRPLPREALARRAGIDGAYLKWLEGGQRTAPTRPVVLSLTVALGLGVRDTDRLLFSAGLAPTRDYQALYERSEARFDGSLRRERAS